MFNVGSGKQLMWQCWRHNIIRHSFRKLYLEVSEKVTEGILTQSYYYIGFRGTSGVGGKPLIDFITLACPDEAPSASWSRYMRTTPHAWRRNTRRKFGWKCIGGYIIKDLKFAGDIELLSIRQQVISIRQQTLILLTYIKQQTTLNSHWFAIHYSSLYSWKSKIWFDSAVQWSARWNMHTWTSTIGGVLWSKPMIPCTGGGVTSRY